MNSHRGCARKRPAQDVRISAVAISSTLSPRFGLPFMQSADRTKATTVSMRANTCQIPTLRSLPGTSHHIKQQLDLDSLSPERHAVRLLGWVGSQSSSRRQPGSYSDWRGPWLQASGKPHYEGEGCRLLHPSATGPSQTSFVARLADVCKMSACNMHMQASTSTRN